MPVCLTTLPLESICGTTLTLHLTMNANEKSSTISSSNSSGLFLAFGGKLVS